MVCGGRSAKTLHDEYDKADNRHQSGKSEIGNRKLSCFIIGRPQGAQSHSKIKKVNLGRGGVPGGQMGTEHQPPRFSQQIF